MLLQNKRIFFIEDDGKNIAVIFSILQQNGAEVKFGPWGYAVDSILEFMPVDLILLDMMLPEGHSGFEIFEQIRKEPRLNAIPIAAVTAMESATAMTRAREMGFNGYINKPVRVSTFPKYINTLIEGGEVWGSADS